MKKKHFKIASAGCGRYSVIYTHPVTGHKSSGHVTDVRLVNRIRTENNPSTEDLIKLRSLLP